MTTGHAYAQARLTEARRFAAEVYELSPLEFGWFADRGELEAVIKMMIARGYMEGVNAALRKPPGQPGRPETI